MSECNNLLQTDFAMIAVISPDNGSSAYATTCLFTQPGELSIDGNK